MELALIHLLKRRPYRAVWLLLENTLLNQLLQQLLGSGELAGCLLGTLELLLHILDLLICLYEPLLLTLLLYLLLTDFLLRAPPLTTRSQAMICATVGFYVQMGINDIS